MKPISPFPDSAQQSSAALPADETRHGKKAGLCAGGVFAVVAVVLISSKGGIDLLFLLVWSAPVALAGICMAIFFAGRSARVRERLKVNRVGVFVAYALAVLLALVVFGGLLLVASPISFRA